MIPPFHFPFIGCMVFTLNQSNLTGIGLTGLIDLGMTSSEQNSLLSTIIVYLFNIPIPENLVTHNDHHPLPLSLLLAPSPSSEPARQSSGSTRAGARVKLVIQGRKLHMIEGYVVEERFARNGSELRGEVDKVWFTLE